MMIARKIYQLRSALALLFVCPIFLAASQDSTPAADPPAAETSATDIASILDRAAAAEGRYEFKDALRLFTEAVTKYPDSGRTWAAYGEHLRFYVHDSKAAAEAFNKSLQAPTDDPLASAFAWRGLGELAAASGDDDKALRLFEKSVAIKPLADTHRSICHVLTNQHKWEKAAIHAGLAAELDPADPIAGLLYATQLLRAEKTDAARKELERSLKLAGVDEQGRASGPVHCCVLYNAAGYFGVSGQKGNALKMLAAFFATPNHRHLTRKQIESDPDFASLKDDPLFIDILEKHFAKSEF